MEEDAGMSSIRGRHAVIFVLIAALAMLGPAGAAGAETSTWKSGGIEQGRWLLGFRAGFAPLTQELSLNTSTDVGSLVNVEGMYALNSFLLAGLMVEWERHAVDLEQPAVDLGHLDTVSVIPTLQVRPGRLGPLVPYGSMGFGVNVNSFGESDNLGSTTISPSNNFAWRLAWGADYFLSPGLALNAEMGYKRNDGHVTINGVQLDDWNASSFGFLFGVRALF